MRVLLFIALLSSGSWAPLQCSREPDPELRQYETPGEALYGLAERFAEEGNRSAWRSTLEYLIERYPNSRFAERAKLDLRDQGSRRSGASE